MRHRDQYEDHPQPAPPASTPEPGKWVCSLFGPLGSTRRCNPQDPHGSCVAGNRPPASTPSSGERRWVHDGFFSLSACTPDNPCTASGLLCGWSDELVDITPPAPSSPVAESGRPDTDAGQLREAANWLDTYDRMARVFFDLLERSQGSVAEGLRQKAAELIPAASSDEVQRDLRRIADALESQPAPSLPGRGDRLDELRDALERADAMTPGEVMAHHEHPWAPVITAVRSLLAASPATGERLVTAGRPFCTNCGVVLVSAEDGCQACGAPGSEWMTCARGACLERVYVAGAQCARCVAAASDLREEIQRLHDEAIDAHGDDPDNAYAEGCWTAYQIVLNLLTEHEVREAAATRAVGTEFDTVPEDWQPDSDAFGLICGHGWVYSECETCDQTERRSSLARTIDRIDRCGFVADYEAKPWQCERRAGHDGAHLSEPLT